MKIDLEKRFKLAKAATDCVVLTNNEFITSDGHIAVRVRMDWGCQPEDYVQRAIDPKAITEATRGTKGAGSIDVSDAQSTIACSGAGKPCTAYDNPNNGNPVMGHVEAVRALLDASGGPVQVAIDGEALGRLQEAMGASGGVILSFDPERPQAPIKVEAVHKDQRGADGAISPIVWAK